MNKKQLTIKINEKIPAVRIIDCLSKNALVRICTEIKEIVTKELKKYDKKNKKPF